MSSCNGIVTVAAGWAGNHQDACETVDVSQGPRQKLKRKCVGQQQCIQAVTTSASFLTQLPQLPVPRRGRGGDSFGNSDSEPCLSRTVACRHSHTHWLVTCHPSSHCQCLPVQRPSLQLLSLLRSLQAQPSCGVLVRKHQAHRCHVALPHKHAAPLLRCQQHRWRLLLLLRLHRAH